MRSVRRWAAVAAVAVALLCRRGPGARAHRFAGVRVHRAGRTTAPLRLRLPRPGHAHRRHLHRPATPASRAIPDDDTAGRATRRARTRRTLSTPSSACSQECHLWDPTQKQYITPSTHGTNPHLGSTPGSASTAIRPASASSIPAPARTTAGRPPGSPTAAPATRRRRSTPARSPAPRATRTRRRSTSTRPAAPASRSCGTCHAMRHAGTKVADQQVRRLPQGHARRPAAAQHSTHGHQEVRVRRRATRKKLHASAVSNAVKNCRTCHRGKYHAAPAHARQVACARAATASPLRHDNGYHVHAVPPTRRPQRHGPAPSTEIRYVELPAHDTRRHGRSDRPHRPGGRSSASRWPRPPRRASAAPARATSRTSTSTRSRRTATSTASSATPSRARSSSSRPSSRPCSSPSHRSPATTRSPSSASCSTSRAAAATPTRRCSSHQQRAASACNHKHLIEAGFLCQRCHSTTAHGDAVPEGSRTYPVMEQCLICHNNHYTAPDGTVATSRCDLCHAKRGYGAMPVSHEPVRLEHAPRRRRRALHLQRLPHQEGRLHQVPQRHPHAAPRRRGSTSTAQTAEVKGRKACAQCHDTKEYCKTCHQVPMPHPQDFISSHPAAGRALRHAHLLQLPRAGQLPGLPRAACRRRPARTQPVQGPQVHAGPAGDAHGDADRRGASDAWPRRSPPRARSCSRARSRGLARSACSSPLVVVVIVAAVGFSAVNRHQHLCARATSSSPRWPPTSSTAHYRAGVGCQQCHTKPGVFNYLIRNLQGATQHHPVRLRTRTSARSPPASAPTTACSATPSRRSSETRCTTTSASTTRGCARPGYQCLTCHANISHPGTQLEVARVSQNKMPICARCHDGKQLPDDCNICHVGGAPPEEINVPIDGQGHRRRSAAGCHSRGKAVCAECHHGLQMPHPKGWMKAHGPIVVDRGKSICVSLPPQGRPEVLHRLPRPRDAASRRLAVRARRLRAASQRTSRSASSATARTAASSATACRCRTRPAGCRSTPSVALSSPGLCNKCHSSSFCVGCHGVELPHSSAFIADHPNHVYSRAASA